MLNYHTLDTAVDNKCPAPFETLAIRQSQNEKKKKPETAIEKVYHPNLIAQVHLQDEMCIKCLIALERICDHPKYLFNSTSLCLRFNALHMLHHSSIYL